MDPQKMKEAYQKLQLLDERLTHRVRPRGGLSRPGVEQIEQGLRDLAEYTIELKEVVEQLFVAIAARPQPPKGGGGGVA